ncbi:hypothetical protein M3E13_04280 [Oceanobacillus kimchii]|uniref:hypothetical protein n=1 Tax=Oceanobacillus kimchii TaxID=746691 RepID=UPI0021A86420|nr:hypothetical protein [Oceanobacillus kimchii]MCT1577059.1 hypothetical protein [Oceanobacillus kimchii]MCT2135129.1 hypothetical protein [Oceanobacillus kimchii]
MKNKFKGTNELLNGKSISIAEVRLIYQTLLAQYEGLSVEIVDSVERNDYVRLSRLLSRRKKLQTALDDIKSLHEDDLVTQRSIKKRIADVLNTSAETTESKGEDTLIKITNNLEKVNNSAYNIASKTLDLSTKTISKGNQLNHSVGKFLVNKTSKGLSKLADKFNKQ